MNDVWYMKTGKKGKFYYKLNASEKMLVGSGGACVMQTILDEFESCSPMTMLQCSILDEMSMVDRVVYGCETLLMVLDDDFTVPICSQHEAFMRHFLSHSYYHVREDKEERDLLFSQAKFHSPDAEVNDMEWWTEVFNRLLDRFVPSLAFEVLAHLPRTEGEELDDLLQLFADKMERDKKYYSWYSQDEVKWKIDDLVLKTASFMVNFKKLRV